MALPSSGAISASDINLELNKGATTALSLNDTDVRVLAGKTTSQSTISFSDLHGKSNIPVVDVSGFVNRSQNAYAYAEFFIEFDDNSLSLRTHDTYGTHPDTIQTFNWLVSGDANKVKFKYNVVTTNDTIFYGSPARDSFITLGGVTSATFYYATNYSSKTYTLNLTFALVSTGAILATKSITILLANNVS
jgi:hypothetical protein